MARAMRAWGEWKSKALRMMRRILVFIDSTMPLDRRRRKRRLRLRRLLPGGRPRSE